MLSLIYVSTSVKLLNDQELLDILKVSRENNLSGAVTGLLLYKGGNFMQVLEGEEAVVTALYEKIKADPRHKDVSIISKEQIQARQFHAWEMAFQNLDNPAVKNEPGYSQFLHDDFTDAVYRTNPLRAYIMLLTFRDNLR
ncbi:MAG: BLUF domain-containing protein [Chloroflexi bacterium]|nr:BLUF domain-containing protein [Chloroflexota bacterium]